MHVKMKRIESGVAVPKGLFTLYMNVKIGLKDKYNNPICLIQMLMVYKRIKGISLGTPEKIQIWRAVLTHDQPKMSSFSVIRGCI
jgi:hypothetical protein